MRRLLPCMTLSLALAGISGLLTGCGDEANKPDAQTAEKALGINPNEPKKTTTETYSVTEVKDTKVIDNKTGKVLKEEKEVKPMEITKETTIKTDVDVKVGETKATAK